MAEKVEAFHYEPHPRIAVRGDTPPPKVDDENVGFNGRLAALITKRPRGSEHTPTTGRLAAPRPLPGTFRSPASLSGSR
jgi:hypothetical protein